MKRRTFIAISATATAAVALTYLTGLFLQYRRRKHPLKYPFILSSFCSEAELKKMGKDYRAIAPGENSKRQLLSLLRPNNSDRSYETENDPISETTLQQMVGHDFELNRIIVLDGWVISVTEARQCALLSIS